MRTSRRMGWALASLAALVWSHAAFGQAGPAAAASPPAGVRADTVAASTSDELPLPEVSDPLLAPVPPPPHVLDSWQRALALVRSDSTVYRNARFAIERAEGEARVALAPALPRLAGSAEFAHHLLPGRSAATPLAASTAIPNPRHSFQAALALTVPLFHAKAWYDHATAKDAVEAERLSAKEVERTVVAALANAILGVVTAERLAEVSRSSLRAALHTLNLTRRRAALGGATSLDVLRAEQDSSLSRSEVVSSTERLIVAREELGAALGSPDAWGVAPDIHVETLSNVLQTNCRIEADVLARSDVRAATANAEVADRTARSVGYAFLPTLDGFSTLGYYDPNSPINDRSLTWTVGGVLNWELFDGGLRYGQRAVARARAGAVREELRDVKRRASLELKQAVRAVQVAEANAVVSARTREIALEMARLSRISYMNGSGTSFDLVDTAQQLRTAELDLALKEFEVLRSKIAALLAVSTCSA